MLSLLTENAANLPTSGNLRVGTAGCCSEKCFWQWRYRPCSASWKFKWVVCIPWSHHALRFTVIKPQRKDSNKFNPHGSYKKTSSWLLIQNESEKQRKKISYKLLNLKKKKTPTNTFQSHSLSSAWIRKQEMMNQSMSVLLRKSYLKKKKKEEKNQTIPEIWQVVLRGHWKLALVILVNWDTGGLEHGYLLLISCC